MGYRTFARDAWWSMALLGHRGKFLFFLKISFEYFVSSHSRFVPKCALHAALMFGKVASSSKGTRVKAPIPEYFWHLPSTFGESLDGNAPAQPKCLFTCI